ncbi:MAG: hypothetical protein V3V08_21385 [Nannocystaceae bacterium]
MLARRSLLPVIAAITLACSANKTPPTVAAETAPVPTPPHAAASAAKADTATASPEQRVRVRVGLNQLSGVFAGLKKASEVWSPDQTIDIPSQLQALLVQLGFGPGFLEGMDLDGTMAFDVSYPHSGGPASSPQFGLAATLPTRDVRRLIEGFPASYKPQPMSGGMWQLIDENFQVVLREQSHSLEVASEEAGLEQAARLVDELGPGRRIRARVWDLPNDVLDPASLLNLGADARTSKLIAAVLTELTAMEVALEMGDDRDLELAVGATAPFGKFGLEPIGPPITRDSALAHQLPAGAVAVLQLSWGQPTLLLEAIDRHVPVNQLPAPLNDIAKEAVNGVKSILGQIRDEVIFALYLSKKGDATLLLSAQVADATGARDAMRKLWSASESAFKAHISLVGQDKNQRYTASYKPDGLSFSRTKADYLYATIPKALQDEAADFAMITGKKRKLEIISMTHDSAAFIAIGAGARKTMADISRRLSRPRKTDLESGGGLALARRSTDACQVCVTIDPIGALQLYLRDQADRSDNADANKALRDISKLDLGGQIAFGVRLSPNEGRLGLGIPQDLIFADATTAARLREIWMPLQGVPAQPAQTTSLQSE